MKKTVFAVISALILTFLLPSCTVGTDKADVLSYQDSDYSLSGVWFDSGKEYGVSVSSECGESGERNTEITFTSPAELEGVKFMLRDTFISVAVGDMAIDLEEREPDKIMRIMSLLSLEKNDITEIESGKGEKTVASGKNKDSVWQVTTDGDGLPTEIVLTKDASQSRLVIEDFKVSEKTTDNAQSTSSD